MSIYDKSYNADTDIQFDICATNAHMLPRRVELRLKSGVEAKDLSEVAQEEHLVPLQGGFFMVVL
jgi:hypothetical protein